MSRPAHIAALDAALRENLKRLDEAEVEVTEVTRKHVKTLDAIQVEMGEVQRERSDAFSAARSCEDAIRQLGYVVLNPIGGTIGADKSLLDGRSYSTANDMQEARKYHEQKDLGLQT